MTQQEFTERTGILLVDGELEYINDLYLNTSMEKDEFCADFKKYGESKIIRDLHARLVNYELQLKQLQERDNGIADELLQKADDYSDPDFREYAVRILGKEGVIKRTIEKGLPLCQKDKEYIYSILDTIR